MTAEQLLFPPFRLDLASERLWRDTSVVPLRPKTFAVLRYLIEHSGKLITNDELLNAVWPAVVVDESMPRLCIRELRQALGDDAKQPRFIETQPRRGYRFIAPVAADAAPVSSSKFQVQSPLPPPTPNTQHPTPALVGRELELSRLHGWFDKALNGERQMVFVTGEVGIGKTALVEAFLQSLEPQRQGLGSRIQRLASEQVQRSRARSQGSVFDPTPNTQYPTPSPWIGRGQCVEHYGAGEAYMPVLEALGRLCQGPEGERFIEILRQRAPTWLAQMPALLSAREREKLQRQVLGTVRERMLREIAEALEVLTVEKGLVLWFEDLQWSDVSTLDLLAVLARRPERARLLVLGTYRPVDVIVSAHPLKGIEQELHVHGRCRTGAGLSDRGGGGRVSDGEVSFSRSRFSGRGLG